MSTAVTSESTGVVLAATGPAAVLQCVRTIIATPRGSVPFDRDFGCTSQLLDEPEPRAMALLTGEIIEQIRKYEPRAKVTFVEWANTAAEAADGKLTPVVYVEVIE